MPEAAGIAYSRVNQGAETGRPPVVLIHGAGSSHLFWPGEFRRMAGWDVYALDLPGHGRSGGAARQSVGEYARQVLEWMKSLGMFRAALVGHSLGGAVALHLALEHPDRAAALALLCSAAFFDVPPLFLDLLDNQKMPEPALNWLSERLVQADTPEAVKERILADVRKVRQGVLIADWRACAHFDCRSRLKRCYVHTWAAAGKRDRLLAPAAASGLRALPNGAVQVYPTAGHLLPLEQPQHCAADLQQFLRSCLDVKQDPPG